MVLHVHSAGAAEGLIHRLAADARIPASMRDWRCRFGAVGVVCDRVVTDVREGRPCDVAIVTPAFMPQLSAALAGRLVPAGSIGHAVTGIALRAGDPMPDMSTTATLVAALRRAERLFVPDMEKSTGGRHVRKVLQGLGLYEDLAPRLRESAGGAEAVAALAASDVPNALAFAQATEVAEGGSIRFAGGLPGDLHLATEYVVTLVGNAEGVAATAFAQLLTGADTAALRRACGFTPGGAT